MLENQRISRVDQAELSSTCEHFPYPLIENKREEKWVFYICKLSFLFLLLLACVMFQFVFCSCNKKRRKHFFPIFQLLSRNVERDSNYDDDSTVKSLSISSFFFNCFSLCCCHRVLISQWWRFFSSLYFFSLCTFSNDSRYRLMKNSQFTWLETIIASHFFPLPIPHDDIANSPLISSNGIHFLFLLFFLRQRFYTLCRRFTRRLGAIT